MQKSKSVLISQELFLELIKYHVADMPHIADQLLIRDELASKLDKMALREQYRRQIQNK